jgi:hypothetical protein
MSQGGGGSGDGALLPEPQPQQVVRARTEHMAAEMLDCHACHLPLKPSPQTPHLQGEINQPTPQSFFPCRIVMYNSKS